MDPGHGKAIGSFDLNLQIRLRLLRFADSKGGYGAGTAVQIDVGAHNDDHLHHSDDIPHPEGANEAPPIVITHEELHCLKKYLPLPSNLQSLHLASSFDINEEFYNP